jgi:hypothetical protein
MSSFVELFSNLKISTSIILIYILYPHATSTPIFKLFSFLQKNEYFYIFNV